MNESKRFLRIEGKSFDFLLVGEINRIVSRSLRMEEG